MNRSKRWKLAQDYEQNWWKGFEDGLEWYKDFSREVEEFTRRFININSVTRILEIGTGPAGALTFLNSDHKYGIDPLEEYFSKNEKWKKFRDPKVIYQTGKGEDLPFENNFFDLVIIDNVLDHCEYPESVFGGVPGSEYSGRSLNQGGFILYSGHHPTTIYREKAHWWL